MVNLSASLACAPKRLAENVEIALQQILWSFFVRSCKKALGKG